MDFWIPLQERSELNAWERIDRSHLVWVAKLAGLASARRLRPGLAATGPGQLTPGFRMR